MQFWGERQRKSICNSAKKHGERTITPRSLPQMQEKGKATNKGGASTTRQSEDRTNTTPRSTTSSPAASWVPLIVLVLACIGAFYLNDYSGYWTQNNQSTSDKNQQQQQWKMSESGRNKKVIVIGGGLAGLSAAIEVSGLSSSVLWLVDFFL